MKARRGFTLVELMIVVAIIGVLVSLASVYMTPKIKTIDVANQIGDLVRDGSRRAVALGPVRSGVALALGSRARTRIVATGTTQPTFTLQRLQEDALPATTASWIDIGKIAVDKAVIADSYNLGVGSYAALPRSTSWSTFVAYCYPDGRCDGRTLFFSATKVTSTGDSYARMSIMPLGGAIMTRRDWN